MEAGLKAMFDGTSPDPLPDSSSSSSSKNSKSSKSSSSSGSGSSSSSDSDSESKPAPLGAIIGGVVGGVVAIAIIGALFFFLRRRKQNKLKSSASMELEGSGHPQHALAAAHNHQPQYPHTIASEIMTNDKNQSQYHPHYPQTTASEIMTNDKTDYAQYAAIEVQEMPDPHSKLAYPEPKELPASEPWDPTRATNTAPMAPVRYSATDIGTPPPPMSPPPGWSAPSGFGVSDGEHTVPGSNRADEIGGNYAGPGGFPGSGPGSAHKDMPNFHYR